MLLGMPKNESYLIFHIVVNADLSTQFVPRRSYAGSMSFRLSHLSDNK